MTATDTTAADRIDAAHARLTAALRVPDGADGPPS